MNVENDNVFEKSYMRAIKGREHHYNNFNYWANFYAIVIGALFVGYYEIKDDVTLRVIVAILGFATTFAWLQSFRGYYHWVKQWINVVKFHEEKYIESLKDNEKPMGEEDKNNLRVYSLYYESEEENTCCPLKSTNISTQKMTLRFVFLLLVSWCVLLVHTISQQVCTLLSTCNSEECFHFWNCTCCCRCISFAVGFLVLILILLFVVLLFLIKKDSDVSNHHKLKKEDGQYRVYPPK